ncbi:signal recognition particle protein [Hydrogenoanaerobacterium saccharovorans]|uniref:Signal recognition particle protein n=1 Tax=Hydrogenoanaerobacterium saccharovorans TaxID=474960 RepID=A0ABS2GKN2_9FIRM|nr:signal recognition particle protein [Hydrogenoanaerobacterium saccharovorans]MBM6923055.1 signal recognition particle protein [Hydrogenoanaerobacterium saccharovorans]
MAFEGLSGRLSEVFKKLKGRGKVKESDIKEVMREVRMALLEADVNYKVAKDFVASVSEKAMGSEVLESLTPAQQIIKIVNDELTELMGSTNARITFSSKIPTIIMMCGLQGAGKTTHCAKLSRYFKQSGKRPLLAACDVYRPAAIQQLQIVGEQAGVPVFEMGQGDPVEIARKAVLHARDYGNDILILDTAGRLHIDEELMDELRRIKEAVQPQEILLVIDAMTGQDAVNVAKSFDETLGIDGTILTKLDGDTRGGAALSVRAVTGKPIKFVGTGEKLDNLEPFYPDRMASRILGMGDVLTLIEKAQSTVDEQKAMEMAKKLKEQNFDMNDLLEQMQQIKQMGSLSQVISMFPGAGKISEEETAAGEAQLKKTEAIINSMTKRERERPAIINPSRKRRIAAGSGTKVEDVNRLLKQFEQMQKMMKMMGSSKFRRAAKRGRLF